MMLKKIYFKELKHMMSAETLLSYPSWTISFTVHNGASDKQLVDVMSNKNTPIYFFSIWLRKPQRNYITIEE